MIRHKQLMVWETQTEGSRAGGYVERWRAKRRRCDSTSWLPPGWS